MQRLGIDVGLAQLRGQTVAITDAGHKYQYLLPLRVFQQGQQQLGTPRTINVDCTLLDVRHRLLGNFQPLRRLQARGRQGLGIGGEGGREQGGLPALRQLGQDLPKLIAKTQLQQAVGLIQHQRLHLLQGQGVVRQQVQQPSGGCHHHVGAATQRHHLRVDRHTAHRTDQVWPARQFTPQSGEDIADLQRQLTGRHQDQLRQHPRLARRCHEEALQRRQHVGGGLTRAGRCQRYHVPAFQQQRNGLLLDRRRRQVTGLLQGLLQGGQHIGRQAELGKRHGGGPGRRRMAGRRVYAVACGRRARRPRACSCCSTASMMARLWPWAAPSCSSTMAPGARSGAIRASTLSGVQLTPS